MPRYQYLTAHRGVSRQGEAPRHEASTIRVGRCDNPVSSGYWRPGSRAARDGPKREPRTKPRSCQCTGPSLCSAGAGEGPDSAVNNPCLASSCSGRTWLPRTSYPKQSPTHLDGHSGPDENEWRKGNARASPLARRTLSAAFDLQAINAARKREQTFHCSPTPRLPNLWRPRG